jgi:hypothetical protein
MRPRDQRRGSFFVSSKERMKKQLKALASARGHAACKVINQLWLLGGPTKLPSADILDLITEG